MLNYTEEEFVMIPMAMNAFYHNITIGTNIIEYSKEVSISADFLNSLLEYIECVPEKKYIIIDVDGVDYAFRLFKKFQNVKGPVFFVNINSSALRDKMNEDLQSIEFSMDKKSAVLNMEYSSTWDEIREKYSSIITYRIYAQIVRELIDGVSHDPIRPQKLDSSGMYSNMYVNVKRLFLCPEKYYAILFGLAKEIQNSGIEYDGLVSSSKNGALLANLLGVMLDKKVIHIMGLGPKYAMNIGNLQKEIKKRKNYVYVFDFRCTGTEMKILSALINANDAYINGAIGIAVYKNDSKCAVNDGMMYLVDIKEEGIPYKIAGEEEDIIKLMKLETGEGIND